MNFLSSLFTAVGKIFGWAGTRTAEENTPAMAAAAAAKKEQSLVDTSTKAAAARDTKEVRDELAD